MKLKLYFLCIYINIFFLLLLFPFFSPTTPMHPLISLKFMASLALVIVIICVCFSIYLAIHAYEYNLISPYNVTCVYQISELIAWYWKTNCGSCLEKTMFSTLSFPKLPVALCLGLRPHKLSLFHVITSIAVGMIIIPIFIALVFFQKPCW